jgi:hypothetical protein
MTWAQFVPKNIMYKVQYYSDISHSAILLVVCEGWHFIHVETNGLSTLVSVEVFKKTINDMGTVCSHMDTDNFLKNIPSEFHKYLSVETNGLSTLVIIIYTIHLLLCNTQYVIQCDIL